MNFNVARSFLKDYHNLKFVALIKEALLLLTIPHQEISLQVLNISEIQMLSLIPSKYFQKNYAFQIGGNTLRFGIGLTTEVNHDVKGFGSTNPVIFTDPIVSNTRALGFYLIEMSSNK